jgi:tetratricopeptide (TPR) repeat protein
LGREEESVEAYREAALADSDYVFPSRLEEMVLLQQAIRLNPNDPRAPYYLGNLLYDRHRHQEAIEQWERASELDPEFPTVWRNLGFGYYNVLHNSERALDAFARARKLAPDDARILYEQDQLLKRTGETLERRLATLEANAELVNRRDDLSVELASLYNSTGQPERALRRLLSRQFQPWEGGEGLVLGQYVRAHVLLAQQALAQHEPQRAVEHLKAAWRPPQNLSEAKHLLMNLSMIDYWLGVAYSELGDRQQALAHWNRAATTNGDFRQMQVQSVSEMTHWRALALERLGRKEESRALFGTILMYAQQLRTQTPKIDYFATSLPAMLLFDEDLKERQTITALFLEAQALLGLGEAATAQDLLRRVQALDQSHAGAIDLNRMLAR